MFQPTFSSLNKLGQNQGKSLPREFPNRFRHQYYSERVIDAMHQRISTLRGSPKQKKPSPRIGDCFGKEDPQIKNVLEYRKLIKKIRRTT